jgi:hypothetical protein
MWLLMLVVASRYTVTLHHVQVQTDGCYLALHMYVTLRYPAYQDCTCHICSMYSFRDFRYPLFAWRKDTLTRKSLGLTNQ